jgi:hypothetical protein
MELLMPLDFYTVCLLLMIIDTKFPKNLSPKAVSFNANKRMDRQKIELRTALKCYS